MRAAKIILPSRLYLHPLDQLQSFECKVWTPVSNKMFLQYDLSEIFYFHMKNLRQVILFTVEINI